MKLQQDPDMDIYISPQLPSNPEQDLGIPMLASYQTPFSTDSFIKDPSYLPLSKHTVNDFWEWLPEEIVSLLKAVSLPYKGSARDLQFFKEWLLLFNEKCRKNAEFTNETFDEIYPNYKRFEQIQDILYILKEKREDLALCHTRPIIELAFWCALSVRQKYLDEHKSLGIYAFAHFFLPIDGQPSLLSQITDPSTRERLLSRLRALCDTPANPPDVRGAYLLLRLYVVLYLEMPCKLRIQQLENFFFTHIQIKSSNESWKERFIRLYTSIALSEPARYGNLKEGEILIHYSQMALMLSSIHISKDLTKIWINCMQAVIDAQKSGKIKVPVDNRFIQRAAILIKDFKTHNAPHCQAEAIPVLEQIVKLQP